MHNVGISRTVDYPTISGAATLPSNLGMVMFDIFSGERLMFT
jgi:hypothetical protein